MPVKILKLGSPRSADEGLRIGTVRRPPRGVPKTEFSSQDWSDVWYPNLAPSVETVTLGQAAQTSASDKDWTTFSKKYRSEMAKADASQNLDLLAALALHQFHNGLLLRERGALPPRAAAGRAQGTRRGLGLHGCSLRVAAAPPPRGPLRLRSGTASPAAPA